MRALFLPTTPGGWKEGALERGASSDKEAGAHTLMITPSVTLHVAFTRMS